MVGAKLECVRAIGPSAVAMKAWPQSPGRPEKGRSRSDALRPRPSANKPSRREQVGSLKAAPIGCVGGLDS